MVFFRRLPVACAGFETAIVETARVALAGLVVGVGVLVVLR
jgi:hypothetical protein